VSLDNFNRLWKGKVIAETGSTPSCTLGLSVLVDSPIEPLRKRGIEHVAGILREPSVTPRTIDLQWFGNSLHIWRYCGPMHRRMLGTQRNRWPTSGREREFDGL
jgi:hypothetical protein